MFPVRTPTAPSLTSFIGATRKLAILTRSPRTPFTASKLSPGTHMWASFGHLGGYSSAYYTYMWDEVIALDFFAQFDKGNPLHGSAPARYRRLRSEEHTSELQSRFGISYA